MNWFLSLISNPYLITALSSWFIAQVLKVIINAIVNKKLDLERLVGDGGMPSGHSATVTSLAVYTALANGPGSFQFAVTAILAVIVCHDATGVRMETGKQAVVINDLVELFESHSGKDVPDMDLKELVGHTPLQVLAGISLGIINALVMYFLIL